MSHETKQMKEALYIRSARLVETEHALWEQEMMVASRKVQVGIRETDLSKREEFLRAREVLHSSSYEIIHGH